MEFVLKQYQTSVENNAWATESKQVKSIMNLSSQVEMAQGQGQARRQSKEVHVKATQDLFILLL
jgi:hypothetical protein